MISVNLIKEKAVLRRLWRIAHQTGLGAHSSTQLCNPPLDERYGYPM